MKLWATTRTVCYPSHQGPVSTVRRFVPLLKRGDKMQQSESNKNSPSRGVKSKSRRDTVLSFREGHVFMALRMVSPFDQNNGTYLDPIPRITFLVDGK